VEAQRVVQEQFRWLLHDEWAETISKEVWVYIKEDFDFD
jgi:hypothetical protein